MQLPQKKTLAVPVASHSVALRRIRKINLTEHCYFKSHITWIVLTKETVTSKLAKLVKNREKYLVKSFKAFFTSPGPILNHFPRTYAWFQVEFLSKEVFKIVTGTLIYQQKKPKNYKKL